MKNIELCPKCGSVYIQYDRISDKFYCLVRSCGHRWEDKNIDLKNIVNIYLRASIK